MNIVVDVKHYFVIYHREYSYSNCMMINRFLCVIEDEQVAQQFCLDSGENYGYVNRDEWARQRKEDKRQCDKD